MNLRSATRSLWCLLSLAMLSLGSAAPVVAADAVSISTISIGLGEHFKVGHWTPVRIELENTSATPLAGKLVLTTADVDGLSTRYVTDDAIRLEKSTTLWRYVKFGNGDSDLTVEFVTDDGVSQRRVVRASQQATALASTSELIVAVGNRLGVEEALTLRARSIKRPVSIVLLKSLAELPDHPAGLAAIDTLILPTSQVEWSQLPRQSSRVVSDWVARGGRLILSVGKLGAEVFGEQGALVELAPGAFERVFALQRSGAIEVYAGATQRLETGGRRASIDMMLLRAPRGRVELAETGPGGESQPLVLNYPVGFGQVTLVTVDLDQPPLASWKGRPRFVAKLLAFHRAGETGKGGDKETALPSQLGYYDLAGQLRTALDQFSQVRLVAFSWVAALVVLYILLIGPLDYYLVKLVFKRMQTTWITLPLFTALFVGLAWWLSSAWKSPVVAVNQADVVDIDWASGLERGASWTHIYSPSTRSYLLTPQFTDASDAALLTWQGLPGAGLGGLDGRAAPNLFDSPYAIQAAGVRATTTTPAAIDGIPITAAATKGFMTTWTREAKPQTTQLVATRDGLVTGEFRYTLPVELEDCAVLYENWHYRIPGKLIPGETIKLSEFSSPRNLLWQLTKKRTVDAKDVSTPWNPRSLETDRILQVMMFHKAAGGNAYTMLTNNYFTELDLSDHLHTGRAILFGKAARRPMSMRNHGEALDDDYDQRLTYYRIVLPVSGIGN